MSFVSPLLLIGLAAAGVPLLVHLIGRDRAPRHPFAAMDFVLRCNRQLARRQRLRQLLLLITRMILAAGIAVMMAKPFVETESDLPALGTKPQSAVLILDDTVSMSREEGGRTLFEAARARARKIVKLLGATADMAVLSVSQPEGPLPILTRDTRKVRRAMDAMSLGHRHATVSAALIRATRILPDTSLRERSIFLISDMAAHGFPAKPAPLPAGIHLHLVDVAGKSVQNRAVVKLAALPSAAPGPRAARIVARVCNYGDASHTARVTLHIDGKHAALGQVKLQPWRCEDKSFQHTFSRGGMHRAAVSLEPDSMPADDRRHLRLEVESPIRVLLVNGSPSPVRYRDELFYLETALNTADRGAQVIHTSQITAGELEKMQFDGFDVVVLCNVGVVPQKRAAGLAAFVRKGGGLLVAVGDKVEAARLNLTLAGLLPQDLRGAVSAGTPGGGGPALSIGRVATDHPIVNAIWSDKTGGGLRSARFTRVFLLRPAARTDRKVLLWYDDGSPALVEAGRGEGRVLLFTSTLDRDWNDLAIRPGYLPLVQQIVRYLSRSPQETSRRSIVVGTPAPIRLPRGTQQVRLVGPSSRERHWSTAQLAGRSTLEVPVREPGFYELSVAGAAGVLRPLERDSFAANLDARESDPRKRNSAQVTPTRQKARALAVQRVELWHALGAMLLLLLLIESFLVRRG